MKITHIEISSDELFDILNSISEGEEASKKDADDLAVDLAKKIMVLKIDGKEW